jgi:hypothetical protein
MSAEHARKTERRQKAMMTGNSRYDPELQMFACQPREPALTRLRFWRWLADQGRLEHEPAGVPVGQYADRALAMSPIPVELEALALDSEGP